jgi:hypothetical protein
MRKPALDIALVRHFLVEQMSLTVHFKSVREQVQKESKASKIEPTGTEVLSVSQGHNIDPVH